MAMQRYIATKTLHLTSGRIQLTVAQYILRQRSLQLVGTDEYAIMGEICLKAGERFGYDGDLTKTGCAKVEAPPPAAKKAEK